MNLNLSEEFYVGVFHILDVIEVLVLGICRQRNEVYSAGSIQKNTFLSSFLMPVCLGCCWFSPAQSLFVLSPAGIMNKFYPLTTLGVLQLLSS
jgi:hypothetical protein